MTDDLGWVALGVKPDASGFSSSLSRQLAPGMDAESRRIGSRFSSGFKKAALVGAAGLAGALTGGVKIAADSLGEAREAQKVGAQTVAVLKSTGGAAKVSEREVGRLATRLSNIAGIDDELIQGGENVLLTFKQVRNEAGKGDKIFKRATKTALDMSVALGTDLKGASIQVGKALNDPVKGITALQRVGVSFTKQQRDQIKALVEGGDANAAVAMGLVDSTGTFNALLKAQGGDIQKTVDLLKNDLTPAQKKTYDMYAEGGHTLDAQKRILRELSSEFKGSAKAQATESDKLKVAFGNLEEEIGNALLPYMDDLSRFIRKDGIPAVKDFAGWVGDHGAPALKRLGHFAKDAAGVTKDLIGFLKDLPDPAKYAGLIALIGGVGAAKLRSGSGVLGGAGKALGLAAPVRVFVTNPGFGAGGAGGGLVGAAGGGKLASLAKATIGVGTLYLAGSAFKDSGIPQKFSQKFFGTDEDTFGKVLDGDKQAILDMKAKIKAASAEWDTFSDNATFAFDMVDDAIRTAYPLMKQYRTVLDGTPRQIKTWVGISGYEKAIGQIRTLQAGIDALAGRGLDNGVPYVHGGTKSSGVSVNIHGPVHVNDGRDLLNKSQQASMGGRPW